jgi:hypothetical protein
LGQTMIILGLEIHDNDKNNITKHKKMARRQGERKVNDSCLWQKNLTKRLERGFNPQ